MNKDPIVVFFSLTGFFVLVVLYLTLLFIG